MKLYEFVDRYIRPVPILNEIVVLLVALTGMALAVPFLRYRCLKATFSGASQRIKDEFKND